MRQSAELAAMLVAAEDENERRRLLTENRGLANLELAFALKDICYQSWTTEPLRAEQAAAALDCLVQINPQPQIIGLKTWIKAIAAITRGENAEASALLEDAASTFRALNENHLAAQTQVAKLYALSVLGRYDEAIETGKKALAVFEMHGDELSAAKIEKNLGSLLYRRGRYVESEAFSRSARERFLALDDQPELAMVENNLAIVKTFQNDFRAAEQLYEQALARVKAAGLKATEAELQVNLGNLALFRGRYDEALKYLEQSRENYEKLQMPHQAAISELEIADVYLELNLLDEAVDIYRRVAPRFVELKMQAEEARAQTQLGITLARLEKFSEAFSALEKARELHLIEGNKTGAATVKLAQARLTMGEENWSQAGKLAREAAADFSEVNSARQYLFARWLLGVCACGAGKLRTAGKILAQTLAAAREQEQPEIAWLGETSLGVLAVRKERTGEAEKHFKNAAKIIETMRSPLAADELRTAYFTNKITPYHELAKIYRKEPDRLADAFLWVERARSQALLNLLGDGGASRRFQSESGSDLHGQIENLREELNWFYSRLNRPQSGELGEVRRAFENLQSEIRIREKEINALVLRHESRQQSFAGQLRDLDLPKFQGQIGADRLLIEFAEFDGELAAFVVGSRELELVENLGTAAEVQQILEQLRFQFGTLRYDSRVLEKHLPELKRRAVKNLQNLYEILILPLEEYFGDRHLIIVPAGNLHYVPFHALHDGERFVIENREISYAPSAAVLQALLEKPKVGIEKVLAVGFADERVPKVEAEVACLSQVLPETRVLRGDGATLKAVKSSLKEKFDVLHLACHGQFRAENPLFSSLHLADGWATAREVAQFEIENGLVVLSACETGLSRVAPGDELLGLVRGFLAAGANSLILSLWTVNDEATARLMKKFYTNLSAGNTVSSALRGAQLDFIEENAHPYFWSPFILVGKL